MYTPTQLGVVLGTSTETNITQAELDQKLLSLRQEVSILVSSLVTQLSGNILPLEVSYGKYSKQIDRIFDSKGNSVRDLKDSLDTLSTDDISGFSYADSSSFVHIAAWGDSLTSGYGGSVSWPSRLSALTGYGVYNGGKGGDTSTQIKTRFLAHPDMVGYSTVIWAGRNNYSDPTTVKADIAAMVASLTTSNYVVLSVLNGAGEGIGSTTYDQITSLNDDLESIYGSHYLDIRAYLVSQYDPSNTTDVANYTTDVPPSSLRYDFLHPNTAGYLKIAQYIQSHLDLLGETSGSPLLAVNNLAQFTAAPPTFGFVNSQTDYQLDGTTILTASSTKFTTLVGLGVGTNLTSSYSTGVGYQALYSGTTGATNDAFGYQSLYSLTTGSNNSAIGVWSLFSNTTGGSNVALGGGSLYNNTTASSNVGVGFGALHDSSTGAQNTAIGANALYYNVSATSSVAVGYQAALGNFSNYSNQGSVAVGWKAGLKFANGSDYNTLLGYSAGGNITTGAGNIWIGAASTTANSNITTGYANIAIGTNIKLPSATASYQLDIGNLIYGTNLDGTGTTVSTGNIGIGNATPYARLSVKGTDAASSTLTFNVVNSASTTVFAVFNGGNAQLSGTLTQSSDRRLKDDITPLDASSTLALIDKLDPVTFTWKERGEDGMQVGFIAQDVQKLFPELVSVTAPTALTPGGTLGVNYIGFIAPIIKSIQALVGQVNALASVVTGFAESFTSKKVTTDQLCVKTSSGTPVCVTGEQLQQLLSGSGQSATPAPGQAAQELATQATEASSTQTTVPEALVQQETTTQVPAAGSEGAPADQTADPAPAPASAPVSTQVQQ